METLELVKLIEHQLIALAKNKCRCANPNDCCESCMATKVLNEAYSRGNDILDELLQFAEGLKQ